MVKKLYLLKQLQTKNLLIRPVNVSDAELVNKAVNNSLDSLLPWLSWAKDTSLAATKNFIQQALLARQQHTLPMPL